MSERSFETIQWSYDEETSIGNIVLDRPEAMNALSTQLKDDIVAGFEAFEELDEAAEGVEVRVVVVEGAGDKAFCAGADINEFKQVTPGVFAQSAALDVCERYDAPVIAKIDGYCLGGGLELAMSCDFRIASERSSVGQPEVDLGIIPGGGGTQRLATLVGPSRAKELCMTGERLEATQAAAEGILDYVHPTEELDDATDEFARAIAEKPPLSVRAVKDVINVSQQVGLREGRMYEKRAVDSLRHTADHAESVDAFTEKREPEWTGK
jgi:enoyl-CoA hydratase/carnithine racemase